MNRDLTPIFDEIFREGNETMAIMLLGSLASVSETAEEIAQKKHQATQLKDYFDKNDVSNKTYYVKKLEDIFDILGKDTQSPEYFG